MEEKIQKIKDLIKNCDIPNDVLFFIIELLEDITILNDAKNKALDKLNQAEGIGSVFVIMHQKKPLKNILFKTVKEARNYIKMQNPKRKFKEPKENVFICSRYGTTFEIVGLNLR